MLERLGRGVGNFSPEIFQAANMRLVSEWEFSGLRLAAPLRCRPPINLTHTLRTTGNSFPTSSKGGHVMPTTNYIWDPLSDNVLMETDVALCVPAPGGGWVPAPGQPAPIDALDAACQVHDCCLFGAWQILKECFVPLCNPAFCAAMAAMSCGTLYGSDPGKLYDCQYIKWKAMSVFCPPPIPPSNTL